LEISEGRLEIDDYRHEATISTGIDPIRCKGNLSRMHYITNVQGVRASIIPDRLSYGRAKFVADIEHGFRS